MINKFAASVAEALADLQDGSTVMTGGFGGAGMPNELIDGLIERNARDLTIVANNAGNGEVGLAALLKAGCVRKIICSFPRQADSQVFDGLYRSGKLELELVPQGNLAERIRAAGAGIGGFFTPTGYGTDLAKGKETREIGGRMYVLESPIHADVALIKAEKGDRWGDLIQLGAYVPGHDLELVRDRQVGMTRGWTVMHVVDETSPLFGLDEEGFKKAEVEIHIAMTGIDDITMQSIHSVHSYNDTHVLIGYRFEDTLVPLPDGQFLVDLRNFDVVVPDTTPRVSVRA